MKSKILISLLVSLFLLSVHSAMAEDQAVNIDDIAGVYKKRFENGDVSGGKYKSEDVLEIVKHSPNSAYFRTHLEFFNGHMCAFWGIAEVEDSALVYRGPKNSGGEQCVFQLNVTPEHISFEDENGVCREGTCGSRGGYSSTDFSRSSRRNIRYMSKLVASDQYVDSIHVYENSKKEDKPFGVVPQTREDDFRIAEAQRNKDLAEKGDLWAAHSLGSFHRSGGIVPQDYSEAEKWYLKAAQKGHAASQFSLGLLYYRGGYGLTQDYVKAAAWLEKAAMQDYTAAQNKLGELYRSGMGVPQDSVTAYIWYARAAATGNRPYVEDFKKAENFLSAAEMTRAQEKMKELGLKRPE